MADPQQQQPATFDPQAARASGASDDYILNYLSNRNPQFDVGKMLQYGKGQGWDDARSKSYAIDFLAKKTSPLGSTGSAGQYTVVPGQPTEEVSVPNVYPGPPLQVTVPKGKGGQYKQEYEQGYGQGAKTAALTGVAGGIPLVGGAISGALGGGVVGTLANMATQGALGAQVASLGGANLSGQRWAAGLSAAGPPIDWALTGAATMFPKFNAPLAVWMTKPRGATAPEAYTPLELQQYAEQNSIPVNAAQITEHNLPRNIQSAGERAPIGGTQLRQQTEQSKTALMTHVENMMDNMSPGATITDQGKALQQSVQTALNQQRQVVDASYAAVDQALGGAAIDTTPVINEASAMLQKSAFTRTNVPSLNVPKATDVLQQIVNDLPEKATFQEMQQLRSRLIDATRSPDLAISTEAQGWLKRVTKAVDGAMEESAKAADPKAFQQFRDANAKWKQLQADFNDPGSPLARVLAADNPDKIPQIFTQKGQVGGSPFNASLLDKYGIDKSVIKRAILQDMYNRNFGLFQGGKTVAGYSQDFLRSVYSPQELDEIYKTGALARSVGLNVNPSGTAGTSLAMEPIGKKSMFSSAQAAIANRPGYTNWMTRPTAAPWTQNIEAIARGGVPPARAAATQAVTTPSPAFQQYQLQRTLERLGIRPPGQQQQQPPITNWDQYPPVK